MASVRIFRALFLDKENVMDMNNIVVLLLLGGLALLVLLVKSYISVPEGRQRLILRWGRHRRTLGAGWYFILPWIDVADRLVDVTIKTSAEESLIVTTIDNAKVPINYSISYRVIEGYKACYRTVSYDGFVCSELKGAIVQHLGTISHTELKQHPKAQADKIKQIAQNGLDRVGVELTNINFAHVGEDAAQATLSDTTFKAKEEGRAQEARAESGKKVTKLQSEEQAEAIKLLSAAEADQLTKFAEILGSPEKAANYLLELRKIESLRDLAKSSNAKLIMTKGGEEMVSVAEVAAADKSGAADG